MSTHAEPPQVQAFVKRRRQAAPFSVPPATLRKLQRARFARYRLLPLATTVRTHEEAMTTLEVQLNLVKHSRRYLS